MRHTRELAAAVLAAALLAPAAGAQPVRPVLTIRSPQAGGTVTPPWPVRYTVKGLVVSPAHPARIQVALAGLTRTMLLTVKRQSGVVDVPDDRLFSGRRDVVFTLLRASGAAYANKGASYTVTNLTIAGNR